MYKILTSYLKVLTIVGVFFMASEALAETKDISKIAKENLLYLETQYGKTVIELRPDLAPKTVARIKELANSGFYDGIVFHRVIDKFMAQTGDPTGTGTGGSGKPLPDEFSSKAKHTRGAVSMANAGRPNSQDSQFFIVYEDASYLDGKYSIFGYVVSGMDAIDRIKKGDSANNGMVKFPDKIVRMYSGDKK